MIQNIRNTPIQVSMAFMLKKTTRLMENHGIKVMVEVYGGMVLMISGLVGPLQKVTQLDMQS